MTDDQAEAIVAGHRGERVIFRISAGTRLAGSRLIQESAIYQTRVVDHQRGQMSIYSSRKARIMAIDETITETAANFGTSTDYKDELFAAFEPTTLLPVYPACATCPASFWSFDIELVCFCKVGKNETWGRKAHPVIACGEREKLLPPGTK